MRFLANDSITKNEYLLECLHIGIKNQVSANLLYDAKIGVYETLDFVGNNLAVTLERTLLADKILTDTQTVWFEKYVTVDVEVKERYWKWYFLPWRRWKTITTKPRVAGFVNVDCNYYKTFPTADVPIPEKFGKFYRWMELKVKDG